MASEQRIEFVSRDYGPREVAEDAVILEVGEEDDVTVYAWVEPDDEDGIWLQQGYDLIHLPNSAIVALHNFVRVEPERPTEEATRE